MAITPGIILIPSKMFILDKPIPGYNNVLMMATKDMSFGVNKNLNYNPNLVIKKEPKLHMTSWVNSNAKESKDETTTVVVPDSHEKKLVDLFGVVFDSWERYCKISFVKK